MQIARGVGMVATVEMQSSRVEHAIRELLAARFPGATVIRMRPFGADEGSADSTEKAIGYGKPICVVLRDGDVERRVVLHAAAAGPFGHERRADRAAEMLLAFDSFDDIPRHVRALDVGAITEDGHFLSLRNTGELYLLTTYAAGHLYADELRAVAERGRAMDDDVAHAEALGGYLARLHQPVEAAPTAYERAIRDLVGSGEGIFGIIDGFPEGEPTAGPDRLEAIEHACVGWRNRIKGRAHRLRRTHGDYHPFNVLFDEEGELSLLDTSRGSMGDPADDLAAMAINFPFFALQHPGSWRAGYRPLWHAFWGAYFEARQDDELMDVIAPFLTWRTLVVANPAWYPKLLHDVRDRLLTFAERVLAAPRFELDMVESMFEAP